MTTQANNRPTQPQPATPAFRDIKVGDVFGSTTIVGVRHVSDLDKSYWTPRRG